MTDYLCKRVESLSHLQGEPHRGIRHVDGVTIVGVPFCGLQEIRSKTMEIIIIQNPNLVKNM